MQIQIQPELFLIHTFDSLWKVGLIDDGLIFPGPSIEHLNK